MFLGCVDCSEGWYKDDDRGCVDINECAEGSVCKTNQFCVNNEGSYKCLGKNCSR